MNRVWISFAAGVFIALASANGLSAGLLGKPLDVAIDYQGSVVFGPVQVTVIDPGKELNNIGGANHVDVDIFDNRVVITVDLSATHGPSPNLLTFTDAQGLIPAITHVALANASPVFNVPSRVSFSADKFSYDFAGTFVVAGDFFELAITTVPEPTGTAFVGVAALLSAVSLRRRRC